MSVDVCDSEDGKEGRFYTRRRRSNNGGQQCWSWDAAILYYSIDVLDADSLDMIGIESCG